MNAFEIPDLRYSLPAGGVVKVRRFVNVNDNGNGVAATAAGSTIGVSMNEVKAGEVLEIADGIVMVEAGAAIDAGADVQVSTGGLAVTKTTGVGVGVALTSAAGTGALIAVKLVSMSVGNGAATQTITYTAVDGAAGADLANVPIGYVAGKGSIGSVAVISLGEAAGIDADNTSVFALKVATATKAGETFDADTVFPASGAAVALTVDSDAVEAGDVLLLSVTNGAAADLPGFIVQVTVTLE